MSIFCGNGIDVVDVKAPNGKPSILFQELVTLFKGDQDRALEEYLYTQSESFKTNLTGVRTPAYTEVKDFGDFDRGQLASISARHGIRVKTDRITAANVLSHLTTFPQKAATLPIMEEKYGLTYDAIEELIETDEDALRFVLYHERSHKDNKDSENAEYRGLDKLDPIIIGVEARANFEAYNLLKEHKDRIADKVDKNGEISIQAYKEHYSINYQKPNLMEGKVANNEGPPTNAEPDLDDHLAAAHAVATEAAIASHVKQNETTKLIKEAQDIINRQIKIYQTRITGNNTETRKRQADSIAKLKSLYAELTKGKEIEALQQFILTANKLAKDASNQMTELSQNLNDPTKLHDNVKKLVALNEYVASYSILDSIHNSIRRGKVKFTDDKIAQELSEAIVNRNGVISDYNEYGIPLLASWLTDGYQGTVNDTVIADFKIKIDRLTNDGKPMSKEKKAKIAALEKKRDSLLYTKETIEKELRRASKDIGWFNLLTDPAIQSGDKSIELFAKIIKDKLYEANEKDRAFEERIGRLYEKFVNSVKGAINNPSELYKGMIEEVKVMRIRQVPNPNGVGTVKERYLDTELQYVSDVDWNTYNENRLKFLNSVPTEKHLKAKKAAMESAWYAENTQPVDNIQEILKEKEDILTDKEYKDWTSWNFITNKKGELLGYKGELVQPKKSKYPNAKYQALKGNGAAFDFYKAIVDNHMESQKSIPPKDYIGMRLPSVRITDLDRIQDQGLGKGLKEKLSDATSFQATDTQYGIQGLDGNMAKSVPVFFTNKIDLKDQSRDVLSVALKFNQMVNKYDAFADIHGEVNLMKDIIGNREYDKTNSAGEVIWDATSKKIGINKAQREEAGKTASKAYRRLNSFIDMVYYGEEQKKEVLNLFGRNINLGKIADTIIYYTSANSLIGNFLSGINNVVYGNAMILSEAIAGQHFKGASYAKGKAIYYTHLGDFMGDFGKLHNKSKATLLVEYFDAMQGSFRTQYGENVSGNAAKKLFSSDTLFWTQNKGEHEMQVSTMFMMLDHTKVKDKNGNMISLFDAYEVVDGKLQFREGVEVDGKLEAILRNKLHNVNRALHGNYSDIDKATIQQVAIGRLAMTFRKFMRPGFKRRFGSLQSDIELDDVSEGFYNTFARVMFTDFGNFKNYIMMNQNTLTDLEKSNIRRFIAEMGMFTTVTVALALIGFGGGDDDDEKKSKLHYYTLYELRRMQAELSFYWNPVEAARILRTPTATMSTIERMARFFDQAVLTWDPDKLTYKRRTGLNEKGDNKSWSYFQSLIPALSGVRKSMAPEEAIKFFN